METFNAKAIGFWWILRLFKQRKTRVIFLQVGPGVQWQQPVAPFSWSSAPSPSSKSWEVEHRCEYSWRKLNNEALSVEGYVKHIWWYDVYIYIFHICLYYIYLVFQSFSMDFHHFDHQLQVSFWWWRSCPLPWLWSRCPRHCFGSKPHQQKKGENLRVLIWICLNCFAIFDLINIYIDYIAMFHICHIIMFWICFESVCWF